MRHLTSRERTAARVALAFLALPGLTFLIDRIGPLRGSELGRSVTRLLLLAAVASLVFRYLGARTMTRAGHSDGEAGITGVLLIVTAIVLSCLRSFQTVGVVLLAATVEEVLFRERLPATAAPLLCLCGLEREARLLAVLASQLTFASAHFVVAHHLAPLAGGAPFVRLMAAGCCLAIIYEIAGLTTAVAVHCVLNVWISTGAIGVFLAPPAAWQLVYLVIAVTGVAGALTYARRKQPSSTWAELGIRYRHSSRQARQ